jgi:hypothetical protein
MRRLLHYKYILPSYNTLLYGEVQSGKTGMIMRYIKHYSITTIKVLIVQNSLTMLSQYKNVLGKLNIPCCSISKKNEENTYRNEKVIIAIYNKFRIKALTRFLNKNNLKNYSLVLDESDQYYHKIMKQQLFLEAKHILHVTATPFIYKKINPFYNVVKIKPTQNYVGIHQINIVPIHILLKPYDPSYNSFLIKLQETRNKVDDFIATPLGGMMLINWASQVDNMRFIASKLTESNSTVPIIVLTTISYIYHNKTIVPIKVKNVQSLIDKFNTNSHIIIIANRYSTRGLNYTNNNYTRFITHQLIVANKNITNFIQKCRILGNRTDEHPCPVLYCMTSDISYITKLKNRLSSLIYNITTTSGNLNKTEKELDQTFQVIMTKIELINICKQHDIKGYSKLKKSEIVELLKHRNVLHVDCNIR